MASSLSVSCCRQRMHYECLARSVHSCGDRCPFCTQDLVPVLSDPLVAASLEYLDIPIDFNAPSCELCAHSLSVPDNMPLPPPIFPLCCAHTCGSPDFEPLNDRRMEWSPIHPPAVCPRPCRTFLPCPQSHVLSVPPLRFCLSCQLMVPHNGDSPLPQTPIPLAPGPPPDNDPSDWFSHGPLTRFASLHGWRRGDPGPPGSGTKSWLSCALISLGLAFAESRMGVPPYSTGNREQVPSEQSQF